MEVALPHSRYPGAHQQYCTTLPPPSSRGTNMEVPMAGTNTLISGPSRLTGQTLTGKTVAQVREQFASALNIPAKASVTVNGVAVAETQVLVDGEEIVFAKPLGQKG
jgi:hypothetical protein